jgi:hypothetical protein
MNTFSIALAAGLLALLPGCINIETQTQPINPLVKSLASGQDCSPIILGFGTGTNTVQQAMEKGEIARNPERPERVEPMTITKIHSVAVSDFQFLVFGSRCVIVTGEP